MMFVRYGPIVNALSFFIKELITMARDVLCEVYNCHYWKQGNKCGADVIYVVSHAGRTASESKETDRKTFKPGDEA